MYIHNTRTAFVFLKHKTHDKLRIDRNIEQTKSYVPENATEALRLSDFQMMPFVYSSVKVLNLRTKFGTHLMHFWCFGFNVILIHTLFSLSAGAAVTWQYYLSSCIWKESGMAITGCTYAGKWGRLKEQQRSHPARPRGSPQYVLAGSPLPLAFAPKSAMEEPRRDSAEVSQPACFSTSGSRISLALFYLGIDI